MNRTEWTAERDQFVIDHRGKISSAKIGAMLGVSRNAILGRISRLGLPPLDNPLLGGKPKNLGPRKRRPKLKRVNGEVKQRKPPTREFASPPVPVVSLNIPFIDLEWQHCREITGQDGFMSLSCGHPKTEDSSYCRWHHAINHTRPEPRKETYQWKAHYAGPERVI